LFSFHTEKRGVTVRTYPEMNMRIKELLRVDGSNYTAYAAQRIEELEKENRRLRAALQECVSLLKGEKRFPEDLTIWGPDGRNIVRVRAVVRQAEAAGVGQCRCPADRGSNWLCNPGDGEKGLSLTPRIPLRRAERGQI
jgi:hypothetical protein